MSESIERIIVIRARPATVWRFFCETELFERWWGAGSRIAAQVGGAVTIRYPEGTLVSGEVLAIDPGRSIEFSYGYEDPGKGLAPGASRVTVTLTEHPEGTRVELRHALPDTKLVDQHVPGWRFQLSLFAKFVHAEQHAERDAVIEAWFTAWNATTNDERRSALERAVGDEVRFADGYAWLSGREDLLGHLASLAFHMPGVALCRVGTLRYAQATVLADWQARRGEAIIMAGTNVFELGADGRIARAVGIPA